MRAFDVAVAALALRASPTRPPRFERRLVPAADDANDAMLDRDALDRVKAALIVSLWPEARPCVVPALFQLLPLPAVLGAVLRFSWRAPSSMDMLPAWGGRSPDAGEAAAVRAA